MIGLLLEGVIAAWICLVAYVTARWQADLHEAASWDELRWALSASFRAAVGLVLAGVLYVLLKVARWIWRRAGRQVPMVFGVTEVMLPCVVAVVAITASVVFWIERPVF